MLILAYMSFYKPDKNVVMKKLFLILGILIAQCTINMAQVPTLLPDYPITKGVSAPFAGFIKNWLIVGEVAISRQFLQPKEEKSLLQSMLCTGYSCRISSLDKNL